jgi:hypothetical protein
LKIKYLDDYIDEVAKEFPTVKKESIRHMMNTGAKSITRFMRGSKRGVRIRARSSAIFGKLDKRYAIIITKVFSVRQLYGLIKRKRIMAINKRKRQQRLDKYASK